MTETVNGRLIIARSVGHEAAGRGNLIVAFDPAALHPFVTAWHHRGRQDWHSRNYFRTLREAARDYENRKRNAGFAEGDADQLIAVRPATPFTRDDLDAQDRRAEKGG